MSITSIVYTSLACGICHQLMYRPKIYDCGHTFCETCLSQGTGKCPTCKLEISCYSFYDVRLRGITDYLKLTQRGEISESYLIKLIECYVCKDDARNPMTFDCGHTFCQVCSHIIKFRIGNCPECRAPAYDRLPNRAFHQLISSLREVLTRVEK